MFSQRVEKWMKELREEGYDEGIERGIEKGLEQGAEKVAINILKARMPVQEVMRFTGLSQQQVDDLQKLL